MQSLRNTSKQGRLLWRSMSWFTRISVSVLFLILLILLVGPSFSPYNYSAPIGDVWEGISWQHPLGTDVLGRDMLTRIMKGGRLTVALAFLATSLGFLLGTFFGFLSALVGRWVDVLLSRIVEIIMAFPSLILALIVLALLDVSKGILVVIIAVLDSTRVYRLSRSLAQDIVVMPYVETARLRGEKLGWLMRREVLPNVLPPMLAEFGLRFGFAILFLSALSFLGLGIQPPEADWGSMVKENALSLPVALVPAAAIALTTICVNIIVDWLLARAARVRSAAPEV